MSNSKTVVSCYAPYNQGGLGRYIAQIVEEAESNSELAHYFAKEVPQGDQRGTVVNPSSLDLLFRIPPIRFSLGMKDHLGGDFFDRAVANLLPLANVFHGFNGKSLHSVNKASSLKYTRFILESANSHADNVARQHAQAKKRCPIEDTWMHPWQQRKSQKEYALADEIWVASDYSWQSFLEAGISESKLRMRTFTVNDKFRSVKRVAKKSDEFHIMCIGRIDITKGIAVLKEAFDSFSHKNARLTILGGSSTRGMNQFMSTWKSQDSRVRSLYSDPIPYLSQADVLVHPTYEDGFALAPLEGLCCGVPAIVTSHTGMKSFIDEGKNGFVIPSDDAVALREHLEQIYSNPLAGTFDAPENAFLNLDKSTE